MLNELQLGNSAVGVFAASAVEALTKQSKPYMKITISDASESITGNCWSSPPGMVQAINDAGGLALDVIIEEYQGRRTFTVASSQQLVPTKLTPEQLAGLLPRSPKDPQKMLAAMTDLLNGLTNETCKALASQLAAHVDFQNFQRWPAASKNHHAYVHGLLEHTVTMMSAAKRLHALYPTVDLDLVLTGILFHDLGKLFEYDMAPGFPRSKKGSMLGHLALGVLEIDRYAASLEIQGTPPDPEKVLAVQHIVASHHGKPEWNAIVEPQTPEAQFVHLIDMLDSRMRASIDSNGKARL